MFNMIVKIQKCWNLENNLKKVEDYISNKILINPASNLRITIDFLMLIYFGYLIWFQIILQFFEHFNLIINLW